MTWICYDSFKVWDLSINKPLKSNNILGKSLKFCPIIWNQAYECFKQRLLLLLLFQNSSIFQKTSEDHTISAETMLKTTVKQSIWTNMYPNTCKLNNKWYNWQLDSMLLAIIYDRSSSESGTTRINVNGRDNDRSAKVFAWSGHAIGEECLCIKGELADDSGTTGCDTNCGS